MPCLSQVGDELKVLQEAIQKRSASPLLLPDDKAVPAESKAINSNGKLSPRRSYTLQKTSRRSSILHHSESLLGAIDGVQPEEWLLTVQSMPCNHSFDSTQSQQDAVQSLLGKSQEIQASVDDCNQMQQQAALQRARLGLFPQEKVDGFVSGTAKQEVTSDQGSLMTTPPAPLQAQTIPSTPLQAQPSPVVPPFPIGRKGPMFKSSLRDCHGLKDVLAKEHVQALPMQETRNSQGMLFKAQPVGILKTTQQESLGPFSCISLTGSSAMNLSEQDIYFRAAEAGAGAGAGAVAAAAVVGQLQKSTLQGVLDFCGSGGSSSSYGGTSQRQTVGSPRDAAREWLESARVVESHCSSRMSNRSTAYYDTFMATAASGRGATNYDRSAICAGAGAGAGNGEGSSRRFPFPFINDLVLAAGPRR